MVIGKAGLLPAGQTASKLFHCLDQAKYSDTEKDPVFSQGSGRRSGGHSAGSLLFRRVSCHDFYREIGIKLGKESL